MSFKNQKRKYPLAISPNCLPIKNISSREEPRFVKSSTKLEVKMMMPRRERRFATRISNIPCPCKMKTVGTWMPRILLASTTRL